MFPGNLISNSLKLLTSKLDEPIALLAMQMIVLRIPVVMFVNGTTSKRHLSQEARVHQFTEGAVYGGSTDRPSLSNSIQLVDQVVGIEVLMPAKNMIHQQSSLLRNPFPPTLKKFLKSLLRRQGNLDRA
jgi:hypothetical protein